MCKLLEDLNPKISYHLKKGEKMEINKYAEAKWNGSVKEGKGEISLESGAMKNQPYGFQTRFEDKTGTNPEELVASAHASCFSMALSKIFDESGYASKEIETKSTVTLTKKDGGFEISKIHLDVKVLAPEATSEEIEKFANQAKEGCPISKLFNAPISMKLK